MKTCYVCQRSFLRTSDFFYRNAGRGDGLTAECRDCHIKQSMVNKQRRRTKDPIRESGKDRRNLLKRKYGMTLEDFDTLFDVQGRVCAICKNDEPRRNNWVVDHNHKTGEVRGILCNTCNTGMGGLGDDPALLRAAADYLERSYAGIE